MDLIPILLITLGILAFVGVIWAGAALDRRAQRRQADNWIRKWVVRTRVLRELYDHRFGPLRLQDQRTATAEPPKRGRRRKRSKEG